jgi:hypothetical protein
MRSLPFYFSCNNALLPAAARYMDAVFDPDDEVGMLDER